MEVFRHVRVRFVVLVVPRSLLAPRWTSREQVTVLRAPRGTLLVMSHHGGAASSGMVVVQTVQISVPQLQVIDVLLASLLWRKGRSPWSCRFKTKEIPLTVHQQGGQCPRRAGGAGSSDAVLGCG